MLKKFLRKLVAKGNPYEKELWKQAFEDFELAAKYGLRAENIVWLRMQMVPKEAIECTIQFAAETGTKLADLSFSQVGEDDDTSKE
ncbi:MAG: hypothetical protein ACTSYX_08050 [Candidatus Thorarchaeota archaeon]